MVWNRKITEKKIKQYEKHKAKMLKKKENNKEINVDGKTK